MIEPTVGVRTTAGRPPPVLATTAAALAGELFGTIHASGCDGRACWVRPRYQARSILVACPCEAALVKGDVSHPIHDAIEDGERDRWLGAILEHRPRRIPRELERVVHEHRGIAHIARNAGARLQRAIERVVGLHAHDASSTGTGSHRSAEARP